MNETSQTPHEMDLNDWNHQVLLEMKEIGFEHEKYWMNF